MNNQVAAECCGSCKYFYYDQGANSDLCHNKKATLMYKMSISHRLCAENLYSPRNPIPIIDIPGVKELVKDAWSAGCLKGGDCSTLAQEQKSLDNYIKALEDKNGQPGSGGMLREL